MVGERYITVGTFADIATTPTGDEGTMSASMDEQDPLLFICLHLPQRLLERTAKHAAISLVQFLPHIDDFDWWERARFEAGREGEIVELRVRSWELGVEDWRKSW